MVLITDEESCLLTTGRHHCNRAKYSCQSVSTNALSVYTIPQSAFLETKGKQKTYMNERQHLPHKLIPLHPRRYSRLRIHSSHNTSPDQGRIHMSISISFHRTDMSVPFNMPINLGSRPIHRSKFPPLPTRPIGLARHGRRHHVRRGYPSR